MMFELVLEGSDGCLQDVKLKIRMRWDSNQIGNLLYDKCCGPIDLIGVATHHITGTFPD